MRYKMRCPFAAIEKVVIRLTPLPDKLEFARRAGGQVVRQICVVVSALRRSVSFFDATNWNLQGWRRSRPCPPHL